MTWARLDDGFWRNPKIRALTPQQALFYVAAISYSADQLTDGRIDPVAVRTITASLGLRHRKVLLSGLLQGGLLSIDSDANGDSYRIHDYLDYNPSKAAIQAKRKADAERKREQRSREESQRDSDESHNRSPIPPTQGNALTPKELESVTFGDDSAAPGKSAASSPKPVTAQAIQAWWLNIGVHIPDNQRVDYLARDLKINEAEAATHLEQLQR